MSDEPVQTYWIRLNVRDSIRRETRVFVSPCPRVVNMIQQRTTSYRLTDMAVRSVARAARTRGDGVRFSFVWLFSHLVRNHNNRNNSTSDTVVLTADGSFVSCVVAVEGRRDAKNVSKPTAVEKQID